MTDTERLDAIQREIDRKMYTGRVILRRSVTGRGLRLHESSLPEAVVDVREAIDRFFEGELGRAVDGKVSG